MALDLSKLDDIRPRKSVLTFAKIMELKLREHDATKPGQAGWRSDNTISLAERVSEEANELLCEVARLATAKEVKSKHTSTDAAIRSVEEAADVANMAMILSDNILQLSESRDD